MKWNFRIILIIIVAIEIIVIILLGNLAYSQKNKVENIMGRVTVIPMDSVKFNLNPSDGLKYFYEPKPGVIKDSAEWLGYAVHYTINNDTLNDIRNYEIIKPAGTYRIITLGDSFTFGQYVNTYESWPKKLEHLLNSDYCANKGYVFEVINLGVGGYDVQYISHRYKLRGVKYNPDLIIWLESRSGFDRTREIMQKYVEYHSNILTDEQIKQYKSQGEYHPEWLLARKDIRLHYSDVQIEDMIYSWWNDFFRVRGNTPLLIATFPNPKSYVDKLISWSKGQYGVTVSSTITDIPALHKGLLSDGHPDIQGHEIIAKDILRSLITNNLIPCK